MKTKDMTVVTPYKRGGESDTLTFDSHAHYHLINEANRVWPKCYG